MAQSVAVEASYDLTLAITRCAYDIGATDVISSDGGKTQRVVTYVQNYLVCVHVTGELSLAPVILFERYI